MEIRWFYNPQSMGDFGFEVVRDGKRIARFSTLEEAVERYPSARIVQ